METLEYEKSRRTRQRRRSILWFNPPWSDTVKTNIGSSFLRLVDKHFKGDSFLGYHFNRQKVKISYSTMPNMKKIITGHNRRMTNPREEMKLEDCDRRGNCRVECFEEREKCQSRCTIYQASIKYSIPSSTENPEAEDLHGSDQQEVEGEVQPPPLVLHQREEQPLQPKPCREE